MHKQSQKGGQKSAELLVREETGSPNDYYRSLLLFPNILYKETEIYFCNNQIDKAHFRLRMVLSLLTIKPAVNLPNSGKAGYGETNLRCRWSSEEIGECSTKIYFKVCPATKYLLIAKRYTIPYPKSANRNSFRDLKRKDEKQDHLKKCTSFEYQCI